MFGGSQGKNLTESQFGIASIKFRWNLSGTYQQVRCVMSLPHPTARPTGVPGGLLPDPGRMLDAFS